MALDKDDRYPANRITTGNEIERPRVKKVISGSAVIREPLSRRIIDKFSGDDAHTVGTYILFDVIIPSIKDMIVETIKESAERAFYGSNRGRRPSNSPRGTSVSYGENRSTPYANRYSRSNGHFDDPTPSERRLSRRARSQHNFDEIILETRGDAESALDNLRLAIDQFGSVSVADLYDMLEISTEYPDRAWGWTDLSEADVVRLRSDQYRLELPPTIKLK